MSKYFQALNRISQQGKPTLIPGEQTADVVGSNSAQAEIHQDPLLHVSPFAEMPLASRTKAYSELLDSLRSIEASCGAPCTVLAGVSRNKPTTQIVKGLQLQAHERGLKILSLEVGTDGPSRYLRENTLSAVKHIDNHDGNLPEITASAEPQRKTSSPSGQIEEWLRRVEHDFDLALIQAPNLSESVEAALLARECDGLVLVVENMVDSHGDLLKAVEKARDAGCRLLGVVIFGAKDWLPRWLQRVFQTRRPDAGIR